MTKSERNPKSSTEAPIKRRRFSDFGLRASFGSRISSFGFLFFWSFSAAFATDYYINSESGDDSNSGASPGSAWKSLAPANAHVFQPGDRLWFKSGTRYTGQLAPRGSGCFTNGRPVVIQIGKYGGRALPRIDGEGLVPDTLLLRNVEFWDVEDLEISNLGTNRAPWRTGVRVEDDRFGVMRHIHLQRLFVHDVNGDLRKSQEGCGIFFESRGRNNSHFDDLLIQDCHVVRTDRNGICQRGGYSRSRHVVIRGNLLEDIGGDGIKLWGSDGGLIEHNVVRGGRERCRDAAAGIWPFDCDDTVIQFNEVSGMKGTNDGEGFDSDYLCRRSLFQYNYSHDNDGGFMLICAPKESYCAGTVIRYNISQKDGLRTARVFHFGGSSSNTLVYNNTIYVGTNQDLPLMHFSEWNDGWAQDVKFYNNIFYAAGRVTYDWGKSRDVGFDRNVFFGQHAEIPPDANAVTNCPPLLLPGSGGEGFASLRGYRLKPDSDFPRGRIIPDNGSRDFFGRRVPPNRPPGIGAAD